MQTKRSNRLKFTPDGKLVLISDLEGGEVVVLDAAARNVIKRLELGRNPEGILIVPDGSRAYVAVNEPHYANMIPSIVGPYRLKHIRLECRCVLTNKVPVASNRGYGRVQPVFGVSPSAVGGAGSTVPGGELQPTKCVTPSVVTTLKRGAPAPQ